MKDTRPPSAFEMRVYDATRLIPKGRVTTYAVLGRIIGCRSAQAIGQALSRNPFAPEVPCHRVIRTDLTLGGFNGHALGDEPKRKLALLTTEGVRFEDGKLADEGCVWVP